MSVSGTLASASGLRPVSAFVVIGAVITSVAGWVVYLSCYLGGGQPDRVQVGMA